VVRRGIATARIARAVPAEGTSPIMHRVAAIAREVLALTPGNPLTPLTVALAVLLVALPLVVAPVLLIAGFDPVGVLFLLLFGVAIVLMCLWVAVAAGRGYARGLAQLTGGDAWARWHTTPAERRRFAAEERALARRTAGRYLAYTVLGSVALATLACVFGGGAQGALLGLAVAGVVGIGATTLTYYLDFARPSTGPAGSDDVSIGPPGVYQLGRFRPFAGPGRRLVGAELVPGIPPVLRFTVAERVRYGTVHSEVRVPVPAGRETEAAALVDRFRREGGVGA
jgi:hypothetical protein